MTKQEREENIIKAYELSQEVKHILDSIVWEGQTPNPDHFDNLNKSEQVALIGSFNDACQLVQSLSMYQNWFIKK